MLENLQGTNPWEPGGRKEDNNKSPLSLISRRANELEAQALAFGARKYDAWNWAKGMKWSRLLDAALRHLYAYADGEDLDSESGLSHLAHARCCVGFLLDYEKSHPELDDRRPRKNVSQLRKSSTEQSLQECMQQLPLFQ